MNATTAPTSPFLGDALAAMGSGRMVVVDGAVDDDVLLYGTAMSVTDALSRSWEDCKRRSRHPLDPDGRAQDGQRPPAAAADSAAARTRRRQRPGRGPRQPA